MFRIPQRFAAGFTTTFTAIGLLIVVPSWTNAPPVAARPAAIERTNLASAVLAANTRLSDSVQPIRGAAESSEYAYAAALDTLPETIAAMPVRPFWIAGNGPDLRGELVAQTERLDIYVGIETFSESQIANMAAHIEQILRDNEAWFGTRLSHRVSLGFYRPAAAEIKGARGLAFTDQARAEVFFAEDENINRALVVTAHELAHHLEEERYGTPAQKRADTVLHEGLATWISGRLWLEICGASSWKQRGRQLRDSGVPLRLLTAEWYGANKAYEMWASFTDYLIYQYGWDTYNALYASGSGRAPGSADYEGVLGKSLDEVAAEWRAWLDS